MAPKMETLAVVYGMLVSEVISVKAAISDFVESREKASEEIMSLVS